MESKQSIPQEAPMEFSPINYEELRYSLNFTGSSQSSPEYVGQGEDMLSPPNPENVNFPFSHASSSTAELSVTPYNPLQVGCRAGVDLVQQGSTLVGPHAHHTMFPNLGEPEYLAPQPVLDPAFLGPNLPYGYMQSACGPLEPEKLVSLGAYPPENRIHGSQPVPENLRLTNGGDQQYVGPKYASFVGLPDNGHTPGDPENLGSQQPYALENMRYPTSGQQQVGQIANFAANLQNTFSFGMPENRYTIGVAGRSQVLTLPPA